MTVEEIKIAVDEGKPVRWSNSLYHVVCDTNGDYLIVCQVQGKSAIGLTWRDGKTLNGKEEEFYIEDPTPIFP